MAVKKQTKKSPKGKSLRRGKSKKSTRKKFFLFFLKLGLLFAIILFFFVFAVYLGIFGPIPSKDTLSRIKNNSATVVYSNDGRMIGKYFLENRMTIDKEDISQYAKDALVATEDSRFLKHKGLDFISLGRVVVKSVLFGNRNQGGGSTISQQLARNLYPRMDFGKFTLPVNKVREIFISARLEKVYSKDEIISLYLNTVPFGDNVFGIEVASHRFFGKLSSRLNPAEAATLIGMLAANTSYNPRVNETKSFERRNVVLKRMASQDLLSDAEYEKYKSQPIRLNYKKLDYNNGPAPYFLEHLRPEIQQILLERYGNDYNIYTDGLRITTSLDSTLQSYANQAVELQLKILQKEFTDHWAGWSPWSGKPEILNSAISSSSRYKELKDKGLNHADAITELKKNAEMNIFDWETGAGKLRKISPMDSIMENLKTLHAGFLAMDPVTGEIKAWVGGRNFQFFKYDHVKSARQVGSTFKPILYATALSKGLDPCVFISNEVRTYEDFQNWTPENYDGNHEGYYSLKGGLVNSVNTISAKIIHQTGILPVIEMGHRMGITSDIPEVPSIALGAADLPLLEMVSAYSSFANLGKAVKPVYLLKIEDWQGNILWERDIVEPLDSALNYETSRVMVQLMKGVVERGTGRSLRTVFGLKSDLAGKTGTTQDNADGWFIGYNPALVAGAWVGADNPGIHFRTTGLGGGSHTGLPIFARFFQKIEQDPHYNSISRAQFPPLSDELLARLDCPDYSLEDPEMGFVERIFRGLIKTDSTDQDLKELDKTKQEEKEDKGKFLDRLKKIFKRNKK